ncbi:MAG: hypothetical protein IH948_10460, partial [Bacteroidetes bacterium]|nr:hypothetical protein [Bacteroidota bacterium]
DWTFLLVENNQSVKDKYEIRTIPMYYIIDPNGNFYRSPAKRPSENIAKLFDKLLEGD